MKKHMKGFLFSMLLMVESVQVLQANEYYENHRDWSTYCMRASNIIVNKSTYKKIMAEDYGPQELTNRSNITIKNGQKNELFKDWKIYEGNVYVDMQSLPNPDEIMEEISRTIVFYMDKNNRTNNYIGITLTITPEEIAEEDKTTQSNMPKEPVNPKVTEEIKLEGADVKLEKVEVKNNEQTEMKKEQEEKRTILNWLFSGEDVPIEIPFLGMVINMTPLSLTQSSISIGILFLVFLLFINDIRMLRKYKRDKEKYVCTRYK